MKTLAQIAAVLSFACFFIAGTWIVLVAASSARSEGPLPVCIGLCLLGTAFYLGPKLWLAADARAAAAPDLGPAAFLSRFMHAQFLRKCATGFVILFVGVIVLAILRRIGS